MADERHVREIDFRPLIVDGALSLQEDGFLLTVDCKEGEEERFREALAADPTGRSLPRRARFTIAHEIAHTFFFDLSVSPPRPTENHKDRRVLPSIEDACNLAARQLLLPEALLLKHYNRADLTEPRVLRDLSEHTALSVPAVVLRFESLSRFPMPDGMLLSVQHVDENFVIRAVVRHPGYKDVFVEAVKDVAVTSIVKDPDFMLLGGSKLKCPVSVDIAGATRNYVAATEDVSKAERSSYFVTVRQPAVDEKI